jgi:LmbE family N-acetylglucosaminyl deacetylase
MHVIAIGAHPDDIEIGCAGALARHVKQGDTVKMVVLTSGEKGGATAKVREAELQKSVAKLGIIDVVMMRYPDTNIPLTSEPSERLDVIVREFAPTRAYIPFWREIHQDHRRTSEIALVSSRNLPQILMYEGPSTAPQFEADFWIDIADTIEDKLSALAEYVSQGEKDILKLDAIRSLNHFRGYQARTTYAEAFDIFRFVE